MQSLSVQMQSVTTLKYSINLKQMANTIYNKKKKNFFSLKTILEECVVCAHNTQRISKNSSGVPNSNRVTHCVLFKVMVKRNLP